MIKSEWNTGRQYDSRGQLMRAVLIDADTIAFVDLSRGLDGIIHGQFGRLYNESEQTFRESVMLAYDHGFHTWPSSQEEKDFLHAIKHDPARFNF